VSCQSDIFDGSWHTATLGEFCAILIDSGDPAVSWKVIEDSEPDQELRFTRTMIIVLHPNGTITDAIQGSHSVHNVLVAMLEAGILQ